MGECIVHIPRIEVMYLDVENSLFIPFWIWANLNVHRYHTNCTARRRS